MTERKQCARCGCPIARKDKYCWTCRDSQAETLAALRVEFNRLRRKVLKRDSNMCTRCCSTVKLEVHHVVELAAGGTNDMTNLVTLCHACHMESHGKRSKFAEDIEEGMYDQLQDRRGTPVFIHSELDDLGLTPNAFRVYCHLARRAGTGVAWPSYQSIGSVCFGPSTPSADYARRLAIEAVKELVTFGLIAKEIRTQDNDGHTTGNKTNVYYLTPQSQWVGGGVKYHTGGVSNNTLPGVSNITPKGIPSEGTPLKADNKEEGAAPKFTLTDEELAAIFRCWHDNMPGMLTPILTDEIKDWGGEYGAAAVIKAITAAVTAGVRKPNYVNAILIREASGEDRKPKESKQYQNGGGRAGNKDADPDTQRANAMYGERKRVVIKLPDLPDDPGF